MKNNKNFIAKITKSDNNNNNNNDYNSVNSQRNHFKQSQSLTELIYLHTKHLTFNFAVCTLRVLL